MTDGVQGQPAASSSAAVDAGAGAGAGTGVAAEGVDVGPCSMSYPFPSSHSTIVCLSHPPQCNKIPTRGMWLTPSTADFSMSFKTGFAAGPDELRFGPTDAAQFSQGAALNPAIISNVRPLFSPFPNVSHRPRRPHGTCRLLVGVGSGLTGIGNVRHVRQCVCQIGYHPRYRMSPLFLFPFLFLFLFPFLFLLLFGPSPSLPPIITLK